MYFSFVVEQYNIIHPDQIVQTILIFLTDPRNNNPILPSRFSETIKEPWKEPQMP